MSIATLFIGSFVLLVSKLLDFGMSVICHYHVIVSRPPPVSIEQFVGSAVIDSAHHSAHKRVWCGRKTYFGWINC